jgi:hypothetical protein
MTRVEVGVPQGAGVCPFHPLIFFLFIYFSLAHSKENGPNPSLLSGALTSMEVTKILRLSVYHVKHEHKTCNALSNI